MDQILDLDVDGQQGISTVLSQPSYELCPHSQGEYLGALFERRDLTRAQAIEL